MLYKAHFLDQRMPGAEISMKLAFHFYNFVVIARVLSGFSPENSGAP